MNYKLENGSFDELDKSINQTIERTEVLLKDDGTILPEDNSVRARNITIAYIIRSN